MKTPPQTHPAPQEHGATPGQHTPEPWHFFARPKPRRSNFDKTKFGAVYIGSVDAGAGINATKICEIQGGPEVVANMRLCAASPAYYAAAERLAQCVDLEADNIYDFIVSGKSRYFMDAIRALAAAHASAKGKV